MSKTETTKSQERFAKPTFGTLHAILAAKRDRGDPPEDLEFFRKRSAYQHFGLNTSTSTAIFYGRRDISSAKYLGPELEERKRYLAMLEEFR